LGVAASMQNSTTKKTIVFFINRIDIGGTCVNTIPLASELSKFFNVIIAYGLHDSEPQAVSLFQQHFSSCTYVPLQFITKKLKWYNFFKVTNEIKNLIGNYKPTIVHTHGSIVGFFVRWTLLKNNTIKKVHTYHGHLFFGYFSTFVTWLFIKVEQFLAKHTHTIVVLSNLQKQDIVSKYSIASAEKTIIIPLGNTNHLLNFSKTNQTNFKEQFAIPNNAFVLSLVGRLVHIKNPFFYVQICTALAKKHADKCFKFLIVGDGELQNKLHEYVQQSEYSSLFIFTSWQMNMEAVYEATNIVLLTSINEGTPLSLIEAQYMGKPVIACNVGGVEDVVLHNITGFLITNPTENNFLDAIEKLLLNDDFYKKISNNAKQKFASDFSIESQIANTYNLYKNLLVQ
jgi:glycosyltransferase involved in cell wall biosynthesis